MLYTSMSAAFLGSFTQRILTQGGALHFGSDVDSMAIKAEARHGHSNNRCYHGTYNNNIKKLLRSLVLYCYHKVPTLLFPLVPPRNVASKSRSAKPLTKMTVSLTRVDANAQLQLMVRKMTHAKHDHVTEEFQSHARDLTRVFDPVQLRTTADHHVCITDSLHLPKITSRFFGIRYRSTTTRLAASFGTDKQLVIV